VVKTSLYEEKLEDRKGGEISCRDEELKRKKLSSIRLFFEKNQNAGDCPFLSSERTSGSKIRDSQGNKKEDESSGQKCGQAAVGHVIEPKFL